MPTSKRHRRSFANYRFLVGRCGRELLRVVGVEKPVAQEAQPAGRQMRDGAGGEAAPRALLAPISCPQIN
ncbi:hypothetical protein BSZ22_01450 [Bradyrhizobium canariense]|uniref:Uncharacterized protein n=1 Tax=Bradyrhizobium canariense TaxID=255045 RepID=A0A1X3GUL7_9BRAD|nr:hypothetical protein BSZ22_01450 [Bradyrhizobium canariense]OSI82422.1 hypothetical protein BSZ23_01630 [Bradyrhizobium canariense]OSI96843.1 hypothetical protein BSZ25_01245 [Bradyrhizobium canariense]OSI98447.1 hypothetical protein BSZ16_31685 [Bradyrhizobium canariense]OSI98883.1 hypothetical protein BSZ24_00970 [Bradyrhizobium canariense]